MTEREAEDEVLRICRSGRRKDGKAQDGFWCMRVLRDDSLRHPELGRCAIIDNGRWSTLLIAQGRTWAEVLEKMP